MSDCIDHGKCLGRNAYFRVYKPGGYVYLHRQVLADKLGVPVDALVGVTRHTCDNKRCINPDHLIGGTQADNVQDAVDRGLFVHGEDRRNAKLTDEVVAWLRKVYVPRSKTHGTRALARELGVSQWVISHAIRGKTWRHVCQN